MRSFCGALLFFVGVTTGLLVCDGYAADETKPIVAARKKTVSLRFSWQLKGEYAPIFVALDKGYFAEEGLDVKPGEGSNSQTALASVAQGQDQVGWITGIFALQAVTTGLPVKIVALYNPILPNVIISLPGKAIRSPGELKGKILGNAVGDTAITYLKVICNKNNIDCSDINLVNVAMQARVPALMNLKVDGVSALTTNDLPILKAKFGKDAFVEMEMARWGLSIAGNGFVVSDAYIAQNPDVIAGMIRAVNKAVLFTRADPKAAAAIMLKYWSTTLDAEIVQEQIEAFAAATKRYPDKPMGWIDEALIKENLEDLKTIGAVAAPKPLSTYYTNEFVTRAAGGW